MATALDDIAEGDEDFTVTLSAPSALPAGVSIADADGDGHDRGRRHGSGVSIADAEATEGGVVTFTVTLGKACVVERGAEVGDVGRDALRLRGTTRRRATGA